MKKLIRNISLVLTVAMLLSITAFAVEIPNGKGTVEAAGSGMEAAFDFDASGNFFSMTLTGGNLKDGEQYLLLMVKGASTDAKPIPDITAGTILFIDQAQATGNQVAFNKVYPTGIQNSVILIAGVTTDGTPGPIAVAIVNAKFILGDLDGSGSVTAADAALVLRIVVGDIAATDAQKLAADVDGEAGITSADAAKILRVIHKLDSL